MAMTGDRKRSLNTVRVSLSHLTCDNEIDQFLFELENCAAGLEASHGKQPED
jgi:selenocysteine lyase/cysteine desulfurase